jgi:asparagine synthetase B (glutamine-hydrolysing)
MSIEQLKRAVSALSDREQADLIRFTLQLRHEHDAEYRREVTDRLNAPDKSHWLTPDEFERRLDKA